MFFLVSRQNSGTSNFYSLGSQSSTYSELKRDHSDFEDELEVPNAKIPKINIMTLQLVSTLDRTQTRSRDSIHIISSVIMSIGEIPDNYNLSRSTIHNARIKIQKDIALNIKNTFINHQCLVIHWDGKLLPLVGSSKVERLPIIASGVNVE